MRLEPVRLQRLHRAGQILHRRESRAWHLLDDLYRYIQRWRRPGLLGRELRPVVGFGKLARNNSFRVVHPIRHRLERDGGHHTGAQQRHAVASGVLGLAGVMRRKLF